MFEGTGAKTIAQYIAALPRERRLEVMKTRAFVKDHIPSGYEEGLGWGVITYSVPLKRLPETYNGQPLCYVALSGHRKAVTLYLMGVYSDPKKLQMLKNAFQAAGKKLDMGKSCLHFQTLEDLELKSVAKVISSMPMEKYAAVYEASRPPKKKKR
jgi:hypothetical protein